MSSSSFFSSFSSAFFGSFFLKASSSASVVCAFALCANSNNTNSSSWFTRPSFFVKYEDLAKSAYAVLNADEDYNNIGQVSRDEVDMTVLPNAYTQIGILEPEGVRELFEIDNKNTLRGRDPILPRPLNENDVFIDIGSGVGNINLQVFSETPVRKSIGIELLPSRTGYAELAKTITALFYGDLFLDGKRELEFITADFVEKENKKVVEAFGEATVIFSHSWMFPKELMEKFGERVLNDGPNVDLIITSRAIPQIDQEIASSAAMNSWKVSQAKLQADWNAESPFYIYSKKV